MSMKDSADLAVHQGFRSRVRVAMVAAALNVAAEGASGNAAVDQARQVLSTRVLGSAMADFLDSFAWICASNAQISGEGILAPDGDLQYAVNSAWNAVAGAKP
jgi:hypothetical protein